MESEFDTLLASREPGDQCRYSLDRLFTHAVMRTTTHFVLLLPTTFCSKPQCYHSSTLTTHQPLKQPIPPPHPPLKLLPQFHHHPPNFSSFRRHTLIHFYPLLYIPHPLHQYLCILLRCFHIDQQLLWHFCRGSVSQSFVVFSNFSFKKFSLSRNLYCSLWEILFAFEGCRVEVCEFGVEGGLVR
jgi:hypothetical protein